jgi:hypothetical protein
MTMATSPTQLIELRVLARVVECFELHVGGLGVNPLGRLPPLRAPLDVPTELGVVINVNRCMLGTIYEMWESAWGFPHEVFLGNK